MKNQLNYLQQVCKKCNSERKELNFDELPKEMKKYIRAQNVDSLKFFHCKKCNQFNISFGIGIF